MKTFQEMINNLKTKLNNTLTKESSSEEINQVAELSQDLDKIQGEYDKLYQDNSEIKQTLIDYVKKGTVDTKTVPEDDTASNILPEFEDFLVEELNKNKEN